ncbi:17979_t:CDS:1, partial [Dentiscutata erythropus]
MLRAMTKPQALNDSKIIRTSDKKTTTNHKHLTMAKSQAPTHLKLQAPMTKKAT